MSRLHFPTSRLATLNTSVAKIPEKKAELYYSSPEWKALRLACLRRDGFRCVSPGCQDRAIVADHIVGRKQGGTDDLSNLRSLCRTHDNASKENWHGGRRGPAAAR